MKPIKERLDQLKYYEMNRNGLRNLQAEFLNMIQQYEGMYEHTKKKIYNYSKKIDGDIKALDSERNDLINAINELEDEKHVAVLTKRYVENKTAEQTQKEMFYADTGYVYKLTKQARNKLQKTGVQAKR